MTQICVSPQPMTLATVCTAVGVHNKQEPLYLVQKETSGNDRYLQHHRRHLLC